MAITIPLPPNFLCWVWFAIGINFGRAFGKRLDQEIQATQWFRRKPKWLRWILKRLLDAIHHWYIGALLMVYFPNIPELYWFGAGLFVDDLPDIPRRAKELLSDLKRMAEHNSEAEE